MKVLTLTSLYPNAVQPNLGVFVENRLRAVREYANSAFEAHVIAPVPWFPFSHKVFGRYAKFNAVPQREVRYGITIDHPRYIMIPKVGERIQPDTYAIAVRQHIRRLIDTQGPFDLIDAHFFYPDGVAAAKLSQEFNIPLVITARGSDISDYPKRPAAKKRILHASQTAQHTAAVCRALKTAMIDIDIPSDHITVLRNGVDLTTFRPLPEIKRSEDHIQLVSVGALVPRKGHHLTIEAIAGLDNIHLSIAGTGPEEKNLRTLIDRLNLSDRVKLLGAIQHHELPRLYNSAHASVLSSSREGWANVLLESLACGTPVVATAIWGTPEVITTPAAGILVHTRTSHDIRESISQLLQALPPRDTTRAYAEQFSWEETAHGVLEMFKTSINNGICNKSKTC